MEYIPIGKTHFDSFTPKTPGDLTSGTYFERGDILLSKITPSFENGKQGIIEVLPIPFGVATTEVIPIHEKPGISDKLFLFYYLLQDDVRVALAGKMEGTTGRQRLSKATLESWQLPLPPLPEQRAIARTLGAVRETVEARRRELALERERKAALMQHLFTHGTRGERRKQTEIGEVPESWQVVRLGQVADLIMGQSPPGETYNTEGDGVPLINGPAEYGPEHPMPIQWTTRPTKVCEPGDILFCVRGATAGRMNVADQQYCLGRGVAAIRGKHDRFDTIALRYLLHLKRSSLYNIAQGGGSTFANINGHQMRDYIIPLPNRGDQRDIAAVLGACDTKIATVEREVDVTEELFRAMLEELMTGRLTASGLI